MYNIVGYSENDAGVKEYVVDTKTEMLELSGEMGTTALCLEDMVYYIKDGNGEWRDVIDEETSGSDTGGGGTLSWNDLTDKPFYEETEYGDTLSINLDALSGEDVVMATSGDIKVSDATPTLNDLVNGVIIQNDVAGQHHTSYDDILSHNENLPSDDMVIFQMFTVIPSDNFTMNFKGEEWVYPEKGTYIYTPMVEGLPGVLDVTIPGYNGFKTTVVKKLDEKYLPGATVTVTKFYYRYDGSGFLYSSADAASDLTEEERVTSKDVDRALAKGGFVLVEINHLNESYFPLSIISGQSGYVITCFADNDHVDHVATADYDAGAN